MMGVMSGPSGPPPGQPGVFGGPGMQQQRFGYSMKPRLPPPIAGGSNFGFNSGVPTGTKFVPTVRTDDTEGEEGDGKRPRKSQMRRTVDYRFRKRCDQLIFS